MARQWADQPYPLISTLAFSKDVQSTFLPKTKRFTDACIQSSHSANYVATQMSLAHNGMIRGLNSIWAQAPNIPKSDHNAIRDFLIYIQCWSESMHHHHDEEEKNFFPALESLTGVKGLMERNIEQHRAFTPGFEAFHQFSKTCSVEAFDGKEVRRLVEAFAEPLTKHLRGEIDTLRGLDKYDSEMVRGAYKAFEKRLMDTDNVHLNITYSCTPLADLYLVSDRAPGLWNSRPELREWHP